MRVPMTLSSTPNIVSFGKTPTSVIFIFAGEMVSSSPLQLCALPFQLQMTQFILESAAKLLVMPNRLKQRRFSQRKGPTNPQLSAADYH